MTKSIPLTQGHAALVDDADYDDLARYSWHIIRGKYTVYAAAYDRETGGTLYMHRLLTGAQAGQDVDHVNHNGLDNRRDNLRVGTRQQNMRNRRPNRNTSSKYKGVCRYKGKWVAGFYIDKRRIHLGTFATEEEAAIAYNEAARAHFGEFARLNRVHATTHTTTHAHGVTTTGRHDGHTDDGTGVEAVRARPGHRSGRAADGGRRAPALPAAEGVEQGAVGRQDAA